tara:strand:+ start:3716 stop:4249 length:534 start_codon:yes stop_codon:yes gene_type:complete
MATHEHKALIIMDMWDAYHPGHDRFKNIIEQTVNRISKIVKSWQGPVVLACYDTVFDLQEGCWTNSNHLPWSSPHILLEMATNEKSMSLISWDKAQVAEFLAKHEVHELFYAGASFPGCIMSRDLGINNMREQFGCIVIIDCVINLSSSGYNEHEIIHDAYRHALTSKQRIVTSDTL